MRFKNYLIESEKETEITYKEALEKDIVKDVIDLYKKQRQGGRGSAQKRRSIQYWEDGKIRLIVPTNKLQKIISDKK